MSDNHSDYQPSEEASNVPPSSARQKKASRASMSKLHPTSPVLRNQRRRTAKALAKSHKPPASKHGLTSVSQSGHSYLAVDYQTTRQRDAALKVLAKEKFQWDGKSWGLVVSNFAVKPPAAQRTPRDHPRDSRTLAKLETADPEELARIFKSAAKTMSMHQRRAQANRLITLEVADEDLRQQVDEHVTHVLGSFDNKLETAKDKGKGVAFSEVPAVRVIKLEAEIPFVDVPTAEIAASEPPPAFDEEEFQGFEDDIFPSGVKMGYKPRGEIVRFEREGDEDEDTLPVLYTEMAKIVSCST
ncbi:hypothetical protein GE09DRAFT_1220765 [Coniochaeta sp. 2T2.1]|nr:hypothetical protein GE09DRAFT_1220765 [Coniochaeta sp. 2T2.1]